MGLISEYVNVKMNIEIQWLKMKLRLQITQLSLAGLIYHFDSPITLSNGNHWIQFIETAKCHSLTLHHQQTKFLFQS